VPIDAQRVQELFLAAVERTPPAERTAYLDEACGGDSGLRTHVEALLRAHDEPGSFLEHLNSDDTGALRPIGEESGDFSVQDRRAPRDRIGPYKLLQKLGEGGMGEVWLANQEQPIKRRVALKIIKPGMDSRQVIARFEQERQALAMMDHPNIAKVLDAGTIGEPAALAAGLTHPAANAAGSPGQPYFVMELVKGIPITTYCDQEHLSPKERLALFIPVCHAVQHAHQKGIIHRDLKPSNVIIALYDGKPVPKVIDFGVAKATQQSLTASTIFTEVGQIVGTLEYMAPEQAELNNLDIDTRADIYSLGVLLYELLTGSPPFSKHQLRSAAFSEMLRIIREVEPVRPSTKLSSSDELPSLAAKRKLEPKRLTQAVHGDLDWIAMKCLEKERGRRYETANALALDIERFLADEPVRAGPPSARYRLRKFMRRNKKPVLAASLVLLALIGGIVGTSVGLVRARAEQRVAKDELDKAVAAELAAVESEADTEAFSRFLVHDVLATARPGGWEGGLGVDITVRRALDEAAGKIGERFNGRPRAEAVARNDLGETYRILGEYTLAELHLRRAVDLRRQVHGADHLDTIKSELYLAYSLAYLGKREEAVGLMKHVRDCDRDILGPDHRSTFNVERALALCYSQMRRHSEAIALLEDQLKRSRDKFGPGDEVTLSIMNTLGAAYRDADRATDALPLHEEALRIRKDTLSEDHPRTLMALHNLAIALEDAGRWRDAAGLFETELKAAKIKLGPEARVTLDVMKHLGYAYQLTGRVPEAIVLNTEAGRLMKAKFGPDDSDTLACVHQLAVSLSAARRHSEAIPLLDDTLTRKKAKYGPTDLTTLKTMDALACAYRAVGQLPAAIPLFEEELKLCRQTLGPEHTHSQTCMNNAALAYQDAGRLPEAIALYEENLKLKKAKLVAEHPNMLTAMHNLAWGYQAAGRLPEAAALYEEALRGRKAKLSAEHPDTLYTLFNLATTYDRQGESARAEAAYLELLTLQRKLANPYLTGTLSILGRLYLRQKRFAEAEPLLRECLTMSTKKTPGHWQVFSTQSLLGVSLLGQKKYAEAEPLMRQGYDGLKAREKSLSADARPLLPQIAEKLVQLYEATNKPDDAANWKKELATLKLPNEKN
jgi:serine/threonine protein kinase/tetratricopeptide (TPR) repeat protein